MRIEVAEHAGFCFGVKRAVDTVYQEVEKADGQKIYTYGPVVHNEEVVRDLEERGVTVLQPGETLPAGDSGTIITRAHGVSKETEEALLATGLRNVDTTCPFVKRIHKIVAEQSAAGKWIIIIGAAGHPEVIGIRGWADGPVTVIASAEEAEAFSAPEGTEICVVSQTTFNANKFEDLVAILNKKRYNITCVNTICNATHERQREAEALAARADRMIVIGSKTSSNSQKLYEICKAKCPNTCFIQTQADLDLRLHGNEQLIGITAGASTPKYIIEEVFKECQNRLLNKC
ncbi:MAG TPA: 4-hydroxy-3-methylbut-2-enyl diphosphate reductase [Lachnospiraceae bacterium]|nr:4-hydroxy-3-methylbut-2-enyl diphosphate reductase [Lachnospiraceae bacterium]